MAIKCGFLPVLSFRLQKIFDDFEEIINSNKDYCDVQFVEKYSMIRSTWFKNKGTYLLVYLLVNFK